jgi:hypothetical protein
MMFSPKALPVALHSEFKVLMITMLRKQYFKVKALYPLGYYQKLSIVWESINLIAEAFDVETMAAVEILMAQQTDEPLTTIQECHAAVYLFAPEMKKHMNAPNGSDQSPAPKGVSGHPLGLGQGLALKKPAGVHSPAVVIFG